MSEIDSKRIEEEATDAVKRIVRSADLLSPFISENDKGPCWDGYVAVYKDNKKTKDGIRRVHVQVKGTTEDHDNQETIKYDVDTVDLEAYREDGGCIYFVVIEKYNGNQLESARIYYQDLLPFKIYKIQSTIKRHDQKTIRVEFKRFPDRYNDITSIFLQFLENHTAQAPFSAHSLPSVIEVDKRRRPLEIPIVVYSDKPPDPIEALIKADAYLYIRNEDTGSLFPVEILNKEGEIKQIVPFEVKVGEKRYYESVLLIRKRNQTKYKIGRSITLEQKEEKVAIHVNMSNYIRQYVKDYEFLTDVIKHGSFFVGGFVATLDEDDVKQFGNNLKKGFNNYKYYKKISTLMEYLGCCSDSDDSVDFDRCKLRDADFRGLSILHRAIIENKAIGDITTTGGMFTAFKIADKSFIVHIKKARKKYKLKRVEQKDWEDFAKENEIDIPFVAIYKKEEYLHCLNIEFKKILESLQKLPRNAHLYNFINIVALRMISAMDEAHGIRKIQLQSTAEQIYNWMNTIENSDEWDTRISRINLFQIEKRIRRLTTQEIDEINNIIDDSDDSNMFRFGAYVLLEDDKRAEKFFDRLKKEEKDMLRTMPIYTLWKKKK